jgi:hypothetical protein
MRSQLGEEDQMATIIVESKWPTASSEKLARTWLEMAEAPESQKLIWAGILDDINLGVKGLVLWQCDDSKIADTLSWIRKDIIRYNAVPDFSCSVNVWTEPEEALKLLGLL